MIRPLLLLFIAVFWSGGQAQAHTRSESRSAWTLEGRQVHMAFTAAEAEIARIDKHVQRPDDKEMLRYLAAHLGVAVDDKPCTVSTPPKVLSAAPGFRRAEFQFICPGTEGMRLIDTALFTEVPTHVHLAQIQRLDGEFVEQMITAEDQGIDIDKEGGSALRDASFARFIEMGLMHIFTGIDHISFLIGLVLISRRLRDLVFVVTGFTIGHSLTLALAVTGIIRPHAEFIDALVALTIALIGAENVALSSRRSGTIALTVGGMLVVMLILRLFGIGLLPPLLLAGAALFSACYLIISGHLRDAGRIRLLVTLIFGLIHGFGFAADLLGSRLPTEKLAEILIGFNLGVEIGQLSIVLLLTACVALLAKIRLAMPRPIVTDVAAAILVAVGTYWFISRSFA